MKIKKDKSEYLNNKTRFVTKLRCCIVLSTLKVHCLLTVFVLWIRGAHARTLARSTLLSGLCVSLSMWRVAGHDDPEWELRSFWFWSALLMMAHADVWTPSSCQPLCWTSFLLSGMHLSACEAVLFFFVFFFQLFIYLPNPIDSHKIHIICPKWSSLMFPFGTKKDFVPLCQDPK